MTSATKRSDAQLKVTDRKGRRVRLANLDNRPILLEADGAIDLVHASNGAFSTDFLDVYSRWEEVRAFAASTTASPAPYDPAGLGSPVPLPRQAFGIGLNYKDHAEETGVTVLPSEPLVFTKFPTCHTGREPLSRCPAAGSTTRWSLSW